MPLPVQRPRGGDGGSYLLAINPSSERSLCAAAHRATRACACGSPLYARSGVVVWTPVQVWEGVGVCATARSICGPTNPLECAPGMCSHQRRVRHVREVVATLVGRRKVGQCPMVPRTPNDFQASTHTHIPPSRRPRLALGAPHVRRHNTRRFGDAFPTQHRPQFRRVSRVLS